MNKVSKRFLRMLAPGLCSAVIGLYALSASAEMESLTESELSSVEGTGISLVLEDFKYEHGTGSGRNGNRVFKITGLKSSEGEDVDVTVNQLYISGSGSNYGQNLSSVNLGRLVNPYTIDVIDGNNVGIPGKAVMQFAAPTKGGGVACLSGFAAAGICSSRPGIERPDVGLQMNVAVGGDRSANVNIHAKSAVIDGSYLRLWGDSGRNQMVGEFRLNFYTPELSVNACDQGGGNCGSRISMQDFAMEMVLGNERQPMFFDVDPSGNFTIEIAPIRNANVAYYTNPEYRGNLNIGSLSVGEKNFGSSRIEGMLIQSLKIQTRDLK